MKYYYKRTKRQWPNWVIQSLGLREKSGGRCNSEQERMYPSDLAEGWGMYERKAFRVE
jgi:hypothetical protein